MSHKFESGFFGNNQPAWHGLGTVIEDDCISADQLWELVPNLALSVNKVPLWGILENGKGFQVPDQFAMLREDSTYLGVVGEGYQVIQNRDGMSFLDELLGSEELKVHCAVELNQGRQCAIVCKTPKNIKIKGLADEEHERFVTFLNSFDGSTAVMAITGLMRVVCWNTFMGAIDAAHSTYKFKHTANASSRLAEARHALGIANVYWEKVAKLGDMAVSTQFSDRQFMGVLDQLIPLPSLTKLDYDPEQHKRLEGNAEKERDAVKHIWLDSPSLQNIKGTAWAAINTWTEYLDHHTDSRQTNRSTQAENRLKRILFDTSLRDRAVSLVRQEAGLVSLS